MLVWAAMSNSYPSGTKDDAGNDVDLFTPASTNGFDLMTKPTCAPGDKTFSAVYSGLRRLGVVVLRRPLHAGAHRGRAGRNER